jgi:hypothetical protein
MNARSRKWKKEKPWLPYEVIFNPEITSNIYTIISLWVFCRMLLYRYWENSNQIPSYGRTLVYISRIRTPNNASNDGKR